MHAARPLITDHDLLWNDAHDFWMRQLMPVAIDLRAEPESAAQWVRAMLIEHREQLKPREALRSRAEKRLRAIANLEDKEKADPGGKRDDIDQTFTRYRRVVAKVWPTNKGQS